MKTATVTHGVLRVSCAVLLLFTLACGCKRGAKPTTTAAQKAGAQAQPLMGIASYSGMPTTPDQLGPSSNAVVLYSTTLPTGLVFDVQCINGTPGGNMKGTRVFPDSPADGPEQVPSLPGTKLSALCSMMSGGAADLQPVRQSLSGGLRLETTLQAISDANGHYLLTAFSDAETNVIVGLFYCPLSRTDWVNKRLRLLVHDKDGHDWMCWGPVINTGTIARIAVECDRGGTRLSVNQDVLSFSPVADIDKIVACHVSAIKYKDNLTYPGLVGNIWYYALQSLADKSTIAMWDFRAPGTGIPDPTGEYRVFPDTSGHNLALKWRGMVMHTTYDKSF